MATNDSTLELGTILDSGATHYRIIGVLGQGGFGITYLAKGEFKVGNVTTEGNFAIKEHFPSAFCSREFDKVIPDPAHFSEYELSKADFISEAKKLQILGAQNDNIVKVNEVFEENGTAYYVMQYINGESLTTYVNSRGKLPYDEAIALLAPIIDAVEFLHRSRINHLDIKPDNIMLHSGIDGLQPVLIDFGLCVRFKKNGQRTTPKGVQGVSEGFSPLEQYAGITTFIPATDIYALMATLLYCLTGKTPKSATELRVSDVREMLSKLVPAEVIPGISKGLNKSYEDRTSSIPMLKTDLGLVASDNPNRKTVVIGLEKNQAKSTVIPWKGIAVVASFIFLFGVCVYFIPQIFKGKKGHSKHKAEVEVVEEVQEPIPAEHASNVHDIKPAVPVKQEGTEAKINEPKQAPAKKDDNQGNRISKESRQESGHASTSQNTSPSVSKSGTLSLGYGTWTGGIRNGKPDGSGTIVFHSAHRVDKSTSYQASPGDYFKALYDNGSLVSGKLYDSEGNLLKTIIP